MNILIILSFVIIILILITSVILYFVQDKIFFHPEKILKSEHYKFSNEFEEIFLKATDGILLNGVLFQLKNPKGLVLYYHNHSGNLKHCSNAVYRFNQLNYDVLVMDYRGFGKSEGSYDEAKMYNDAELWYNHAKLLYDERDMVVYGRGLGATFAGYVSSINNPKYLCLESAMYSLIYASKFHYRFLPKKLFIKYKFNLADNLKNVACNTFIFHGMKDNLIHYSNSEKLHDISKEKSELILIPEGDHYNLGSNPIFLHKIEGILS
jgi:hypothetical protein